jgi:hypothetical protein
MEPNSFRTRLWFLEESERYRTVKPYAMRFASPIPSLPRSNCLFQKADNVPIQDVRKVGPMDFERNGFTFMELDSPLTFEDCADRKKVEQLYLKDLKPLLCDFFKTSHVVILDHTLRRRERGFPVSHGQDYDTNQPVMVAHIDWTKEEVDLKILEAMGSERSEKIFSGRYQYVHAWKPLNGPVKDWPLAFCDSSSVDPYKDLEAGDYINDDENYNTEETYQVYHRPYYRWYYLSDQKTNELAVFRQYDSKLGLGSGCPHVAFPDPTATGKEPLRESIELQVIVYYDS